jgi:DNA primase
MLLLYAPEAEQARQYVQSRGLLDDTLAAFRIGFALDSWSACRTHFNDKGYTDDELVQVGLLTEHPEKDTRYDRFRNRLMIPIGDNDGRIVGFGARTLDKDGLPKYLNSPQTPLFDKSHILFGLDRAKRSIREARQAVIVEGYMDVIAAWQAGFGNVVAQMGTALTERQLQLLKRYTKRFVLALDADAAGAKATMRSLQVARETLDREVEVRFDARGLVQHEGRLQADIRIVTMPAGDDPDSIIRRDVSEWPRLLAQAKPIVAYVIDVATQGVDLREAKAKTAVAQQVIPLIKDIVNPVERDHYWQELARALHTDERALRQMPMQQNRPRSAAAQPAAQKQKKIGNGRVVDMRQINYLRECIHYPQIMKQINLKLAQCRQPLVAETDFSMPEDRELLKRMIKWVEQGNIVTITEMWDSLDEDVLQERAKYLLQTAPTPESELSRLPEKLALSVLHWRLERVKGHLSELQQLIRETNRNDQPELADLYSQQIRESHLMIQSLNRAAEAVTAIKEF